MIEESTNQLLDSKQTQAELMETLDNRGNELEQLTSRSTDLDERLREEVERKDFLALELHKAEGKIMINSFFASGDFCKQFGPRSGVLALRL